MNLPKLTPDEQKRFENGVIQVNGKAMNRTALGIIDAYLKLNPKATFVQLKEAFPDSINPSGPRAPKTIFKPFTDRDFGVVHSLDEIKNEFGKAGLPYEGLFFLEKNEMFTTADGVTVVVNKLWESKDTETGESDLENLAKQAIKFGIVVNKFEAKKTFGRGSYSLDVVDPDIFQRLTGTTKIVEKKVTPFWIWIVLALALIPIILWLAGVFKGDPVILEREVIVIQKDTVYIKEIDEIETKFNTVRFEQGNFVLPEEAKFALYDLAKVLERNPSLRLKIEGHTSDEGNPEFNQKLSENRAKAVVDFLIERGVNANRLDYEGLGSSKPIDSKIREANRRTEFKIIE